MINSLKQELTNLEVPTEVHAKSKMGVKQAKSEMEAKVRRYVRRRIVTVILAGCLIIPTGVYAYEALLADGIFGSFENFKKHVSGATMERYLLLNAKLNQAKGDLGQEQFEHFKELLKVIMAAKLEYGNSKGHIDYSQVSSNELEKLKGVLYEIQPYFDQLNGLPSSKEVLTSEEYEQYIDAIITYEQVLVESGNDLKNIPADLQDDLNKARDVLYDVNDKQLQYQN